VQTTTSSALASTLGDGFIVSSERAASWGQAAESARRANILRRYVNGRDLMQVSRNVEVIDFFGFDEETARQEHSVLFQHLFGLREAGARSERSGINPANMVAIRMGASRPPQADSRAQTIHRYDRNREAPSLRLPGLVSTSGQHAHDNCVDDAFFLGVLSSRIH